MRPGNKEDGSNSPAANGAPPLWERPFLVPAFTAWIGVMLSLGWFSASRGWERENLLAKTHDLALERTELLRGKMLGSMEVMASVAALCDSREKEVSRAEFHAFVRDALARHHEIQALSWNPRVPADQRGAREAAERADGAPDFRIWEMDAGGESAAVAARAEYVPVCIVEPWAGNERSLGFDLASSPERRASLDRARDTGLPDATAPLRLVQEPGDQAGFLVLNPVYRGEADTVAARRAHLAGFVSAVFRIGDLVEQALGKVNPGDLDFEIHDDTHSNALIFSRASAAFGPDADPDAPRWAETLAFPGGKWQIVFQATPRYLAVQGRSWQSAGGLAAGLLITLLATAYLWRGNRRTAEIELRVRARTAQLSAEVAERERVEDELRRAEAKYRSIFENSVEGIFQTTRSGHYLSANPALARLYGYDSPAELIADLADIERQLYVEPDRRREFVRLIQEHGSVTAFESQVRRKDGRLIWISETARDVRDARGETLYYEGAASEITERKRADEMLRTSRDALEARVVERTAALAHANAALRAEVVERQRAEAAAATANAAKSAFLAHISHEIRTPLNAILGYAQILRRDATLRAEHRPAIETISSSGNHLLGLIDDVLDLSKIEAGRMDLRLTRFDPRQLLARVETMFSQQCRQKGILLKVEAPEALPACVRGDEGKLRQVLINLLGNAVKFTDAGEICLSVGWASDGAGLCSFEVRDTGIGIAPEAQATIFEPFLQGDGGRHKGGTGLGLSIARRQIELMGGRLALESIPGEGSRFHFTLALPEEARPAAAPHPAPRAAGKRVLIVDDVAANRDVLATMLHAAGCETTLAGSGPEALSMARSHPPDVIFIDLRMPGMDGVQTARHLRAEAGPRIRLVAHSASAAEGDPQRCFEAGFDDFLAKPLRYERVCEALGPVLPPAGASPEPLDAAAIAQCRGLWLRSPALWERVQAAAELYSLTELQECVREVADLGPAGRRLAGHLEAWLAGCDIESIQRFLAEAAPERHAVMS